MIRFVIVEDEEKYVREIRKIIDKLKYNIKEDVKTLVFSGYNKLLEETINNSDQRTIYILDIELDNSKSGIEIASLIRENDWDSEIIFITNHDKMFETAHRSVYEVFDFIEKYHNFSNRLKNDINVILKKSTDKKMLSYKGRNVDMQLYLHTIKYIYRDKEDRKLVIITENSEFLINMSLKEILDYLDDRFKTVHRSCIVNTDKVEVYDWQNSKILLRDGTEVNYLSKKYKKGVTNHDN